MNHAELTERHCCDSENSSKIHLTDRQAAELGNTGLGKKVVPRLRELAPRGQRESGSGIHVT